MQYGNAAAQAADDRALGPDALDARAGRSSQNAADSFDRSDTDGFVTQWASSLSARRDAIAADLLRSGGTSDFDALFDLDGNWIPARIIDGTWGPRWMVLDANGRSTGVFLPARPKRRSTLAKRGYTVGRVTRPAAAVIAAPDGARGLSGAALCYVAIVPADRPTDPPLAVVTPDAYVCGAAFWPNAPSIRCALAPGHACRCLDSIAVAGLVKPDPAFDWIVR